MSPGSGDGESRGRDDSRPQSTAVGEGLVENYRTILNELSLLTTVSVLLFGFLLASPSIARTSLEEWVYAVAIVMVATATLIFVLPVAYHHLQYPYSDLDKFQRRTHHWMGYGLPLLGMSLYLSLVLSITSIFEEAAVVIAGLPLLAILVLYFTRRS